MGGLVSEHEMNFVVTFIMLNKYNYFKVSVPYKEEIKYYLWGRIESRSKQMYTSS